MEEKEHDIQKQRLDKLRESYRPILKLKLKAQLLRRKPPVLLKKIFDICERDGVINNVDNKYYNNFIDMPDNVMETLIKAIIYNNVDSINRIVFDHTKTDDEKDVEIYEKIELFLSFIAKGIMVFTEEKELKIVFTKPAGVPPDVEIEARIEKKIKGARPLMEIAMLKCCKNYTPDDKEIQTYISDRYKEIKTNASRLGEES